MYVDSNGIFRAYFCISTYGNHGSLDKIPQKFWSVFTDLKGILLHSIIKEKIEGKIKSKIFKKLTVLVSCNILN